MSEISVNLRVSEIILFRRDCECRHDSRLVHLGRLVRLHRLARLLADRQRPRPAAHLRPDRPPLGAQRLHHRGGAVAAGGARALLRRIVHSRRQSDVLHHFSGDRSAVDCAGTHLLQESGRRQERAEQVAAQQQPQRRQPAGGQRLA